jgi:hypothetical protein
MTESNDLPGDTEEHPLDLMRRWTNGEADDHRRMHRRAMAGLPFEGDVDRIDGIDIALRWSGLR